MGMFDYYKPNEKILCPVCKVELNEWQGKDADCALLLWIQGQSYPEYSVLICEEVKMPEEIRQTWRLPESFTFYSNDCEKHWVWVEGKTENEIWVNSRVILVEDLEKRAAEIKRKYYR